MKRSGENRDSFVTDSKRFRAENLSDSTESDDDDDTARPPPLGTSAAVGPSQSGPAQAAPLYNSFAERMMAKMGYRKEEGLGKHGQGRKDIVEASTQRGRRGLGLKLEAFDGEIDIDWTDEEPPSVHERPEWLPACENPVPSKDTLQDWVLEGTRKNQIEDEVEFCGEEILLDLLKCKSVFDVLEGQEMRNARTRANPYETIRGAIFQNRAAMKMANMDHVFDYMFTDPKNDKGEPMVGAHDLLYFADICAGPGGFSEYVLWRKKWHAKGFGLTIRGPNDFKLEEFFAASSEMFEPYYGEGGIDGDGDIMKPANLTAFKKFVLDSTEGKGVHFVMGDGGFSVEGQENLQEVLSKQLVLCEFLCALSILRIGGCFVCKTFDVFTPFSVGLVYLLYHCFHQVCIFKPITSRPANSERYVVCKGLKPGYEVVEEYLFKVNIQMNRLKNTDVDVNEVVPLDIIKKDSQFFQYMVSSNEKLAEKQTKHLAKIRAYTQDTTLFEAGQGRIRKEALQLWKVPDEARVAPQKPDSRVRFTELAKAKMGYRKEEGLGKHGQGRKDIVEASTQRGRRGLGLKLEAFDGEIDIDWTDEEPPSVHERPEWLPACKNPVPSKDTLQDWVLEGTRKNQIEDEVEFCGEEILLDLLKCKSVFDVLEGQEMRNARTRANPYETIRGAIFQNRAAMKMANMDHVFDYMFTDPKNDKGEPMVGAHDLLYFADICAGPGGFSEYVLWRKKWHAKGFGLTIRGPNDFKLEEFFAASSEMFEPYYGEFLAIRTLLFQWDGRPTTKWMKLDLNMELPKDTLLVVEVVQELKGEGKAQRKITAMHIVDAYVLNGEDISSRHFSERVLMAEKFVKAVSKPSRPDMAPLRTKEVYRLEEVEKIFHKLEMRLTKGSRDPRLCYSIDGTRHFLPCGVHFIRTVNDPWVMQYSKSWNKKYFFNSRNGSSTFDCPPEAIAPFRVCYANRIFWAWEDGVKVHDSHKASDSKVSRDMLVQYVHRHLK
ncbi:PREDICTED: LOW QUALITY PROTEIN: cap-specific mRNA (nucleoside-2'-O-)-methyltransferase 1-like [Branchiostoma belcheri]|uniref:Cap-specific mRNA (nucleoside-2'-O-)-methyltransferase 1 n=1 Tax=Branchiostoma belcheri TaxID=7741 RepID=A0A6P4Y635_BRABE|nr:PREDICTED: LOW QUALITY PROTEIN: cap-specific mRNA (nucleoside-2'-O-)-methyltransferase 1-like [Branchiostoma belcheri]